MLTRFGKEVRKLRIEKGVTLKQMATALGKTSAYLSAVETGRKNLPDQLVNDVANYFDLADDGIQLLKRAAELSHNVVNIPMNGVSEPKREVATAFARQFPTLSDETLSQIRSLLERQVD